MHYNTKTAEEFAKKIKRGYPGNKKESLNYRMKVFFNINKLTRKKVKIFENFLM